MSLTVRWGDALCRRAAGIGGSRGRIICEITQGFVTVGGWVSFVYAMTPTLPPSSAVGLITVASPNVASWEIDLKVSDSP